MTAQLIVCADDFGRSANIDEAILRLARASKVTAVSVMVGEPNIFRSAPALSELAREIDIGLHLTFSDGTALSSHANYAPDRCLPTIDRLTARAFLGRLPVAAIAIETALQIERFHRLFGIEPHFVDAHQHAHVLPGIRETVLDATLRLSPHSWIRSCEDSLAAIIGRGSERVRALRSSFLSVGVSAAAVCRGLRTNDSFSGLYDLGGNQDYAALFPRFLRHPGTSNHLVICHPAVSFDEDDPIGTARVREFDYLSHTSVRHLADDAGLTLGKFGR